MHPATLSRTHLSVLVVSCSLRVTSRSHRLAQAAEAALHARGADAELIDLREWDLPLCDGADSYDHPSVRPLSAKIASASAVLLSSPVYNYDVNAAAKNLVEMTGSAWKEKPVGFLCAAGGPSSYMSPIGLASSLMFDFRSLIIPRFVYATDQDFEADGGLVGPMQARVEGLVGAAVDLARALAWLQSARGDRLSS
jgi:FMN reductase